MAFGKKPFLGGNKDSATPPPAAPAPEEPVSAQPAATPANTPPATQPNAAPAAPLATATTADAPAAPQPITPAAQPAPDNPAAPTAAPTIPPNAPDDIGKIKQAAEQLEGDSTPVERYTDSRLETSDYKQAKWLLAETLLSKLNFKALEGLTEDNRREKIRSTAANLIPTIQIPLNGAQQSLLEKQIIDEIMGFGPIEVLMKDPDVSDIMINTCNSIYIEKSGKLYKCDITFSSESHLINVIQRIVSLVGRRVDESSPMVDARMPDGSRFNAIIPPLSIDGSLVSIRKFKQYKMPLSDYVGYKSMTPEMATFLEICGNIRLNILVSGGTGSGKTTLLNALSGHIDPGERVITIEDAAELQMHQPHILRLETRPPNTEGVGEINQRMLVKNALRMRPDRIILGEIRGDEIIDVLAAMNTGHEGSMATIHANNPRECLSRIENLIGMSGINMPINALRAQVASAVHLIVQLSRMRDGGRRITHIEEVVGMEGDVITTQQLYGYKPGPMGDDGKLTGHFFCNGIKPRFAEQASYFNRDKEMAEALKMKNPGDGMGSY